MSWAEGRGQEREMQATQTQQSLPSVQEARGVIFHIVN